MKGNISRHSNRTILAIALAVYCVVLCLFIVSGNAKASEDHPVVVSLGDSYSSGEGVEPFYGQNEKHHLKNEDWLAHRSEKSWPGKLRIPVSKDEDVTLSEVRDGGDLCDWYFKAASGAKTENLSKIEQEVTIKKSAVIQKTHHLPCQLKVFDGLNKGDVDYVTITIGGNDADFVGIISCAAVNAQSLLINGVQDKLNNVWKKYNNEIRYNLYEAYREIEEKAGKQAKIIVAGYPRLLDEEEGEACVFHPEESRIINNAVSDFNRCIQYIVSDLKNNEKMNIEFVSVEERFRGHEAYSEDEYINEVILDAKKQDLDQTSLTSAYSIHPNEKGTWAYARAVQQKIDQLEDEKNQESVDTQPSSGAKDGKTRDIVLVMDSSGSMEGDPIDELKRALTRFGETVLGEKTKVSVVRFANKATTIEPLTDNKERILMSADKLDGSGGTNMGEGLKKAEGILSGSSADRKIIILMSDGEPNQGMDEEELAAYAKKLKDKGYYVYTLGFFSGMEPGSKASPQQLLEHIASEGCHYEVTDASDLKFFFGDIADQINGVRYNYIRIACPVDVTVKHNGETLSSEGANSRERTSFGTLTFEDAKESDDGNEADKADAVKILRLKEGPNYDVRINGTGKGSMDYRIGFVDDNGEYSDMRYFDDISISPKTHISTVAKVADKTKLTVDFNGDGNIDQTYEASSNSHAKAVNNKWIVVIVMLVSILVLLLILVSVLRNTIKRKRNSTQVQSFDKSNYSVIKTSIGGIVKNRYKIINMLLMMIVIILFVFCGLTKAPVIIRELSMLDILPAAFGALLFMVCVAIPIIISVIGIQMMLLSAKNDRSEIIDKRPSNYIPGIAGVPIIAIVIICAAILVSNYVVPGGKVTEMGAAMIQVLSVCWVSAILGIVISIASSVIIVISRKSTLG